MVSSLKRDRGQGKQLGQTGKREREKKRRVCIFLNTRSIVNSDDVPGIFVTETQCIVKAMEGNLEKPGF